MLYECMRISHRYLPKTLQTSIRPPLSPSMPPCSAASELKTNFVATQPSSWFAELFARDNLTGGHVIMLGASEANERAAIEALQAYPGGLQLGGGVTAENAARYLMAGASHVIVTSYVFQEGRLNERRLAGLVGGCV